MNFSGNCFKWPFICGIIGRLAYDGGKKVGFGFLVSLNLRVSIFLYREVVDGVADF